MSIGTNLRKLREDHKFTQEQVAEKVDVSFQAVSSWERDEYKPDTDKLMRLAAVFDVSVSAIVEERSNVFDMKDTIYNWEHMRTYVKATAKSLGLTDTMKAVDYAVKAHEGQTRKRSDVPYIYHPLNLACHALSMDIREDEVIAACLLHDVVEDCGKTYEELPVDDRTRELVKLLTHSKTTDKDRDAVMKRYYDAIAHDPQASLIKCIDRCNNITTMAWGLRRERIYRTIKETEMYFPRLLKTVKADPRYNNAGWLLKYQIESMIEIYKRLM